MKQKEVIRIGKILDKYLNYKGFNLWEMAEAGIYNNFLKMPRELGLLEKQKHKAMKFLIDSINRKREQEKVLGQKHKSEILVVVYDSSHVKTIIPLVRGKFDYKIIRADSPANENTKKILERMGEEYDNLDSYMNSAVRMRIKHGEEWMNETWKKIIKNLKGLRDRLGGDYLYVVDVLEYHFKTRKRFLEIIRYIELFEEVFKKEKTKLVLVSDDVNPIGRIVCLIARKNKIKSLDIQHGPLQGHPVGKITADKMIVNSLDDERFLIENGGDKKRIITMGQSRFERGEMIAKFIETMVRNEE